MKNFSKSPKELIASFWRNRELTYALTKREILNKYRDSLLGLFWSFFQPVLMLIIYTFVFSVVFKARWHAGSDSKTEFALVLFAGLLVFNLFSECINRAPNIILSNPNYVKKILFPLEILPWVCLGTSLFQALINLIVWLIFYIVIFGLPHATVALFPLLILPIIFFSMGVSWLLSSISIYIRDIRQLIGIAITILMFISPIFYPLSALPPKYRYFLQFNPLTPAIEEIRDILYWGNFPDMKIYTCYLITSIIFSWLGFCVFQKIRKGFADVI